MCPKIIDNFKILKNVFSQNNSQVKFYSNHVFYLYLSFHNNPPTSRKDLKEICVKDKVEKTLKLKWVGPYLIDKVI